MRKRHSEHARLTYGAHVDAKADPLNDDIGALLKRLQSRVVWGKTQESTRAELISLLKSKEYIFFQGGYRGYSLNVGESCIYDVPERKRGHLRVFAGKRIRIVCVARTGGLGARKLAAGVYTGALAG
jgi:hypothetical protein